MNESFINHAQLIFFPAIAHHIPKKRGVAHQIAASHPARLDRESEQPFCPETADPVRRARHATGRKVEISADAHNHGANSACVTSRPDFLARLTHADEYKVGCAGDNALFDLRCTGFVEEAVLRTDHYMVRKTPTERVGGALRHARRASQQKNTERFLDRAEQCGREIRAVEIVGETLAVQHPARDVDTYPVIQDSCTIESVGESGIGAGEIDGMRVAECQDACLSAGEALGRHAKRGVLIEHVDGDRTNFSLRQSLPLVNTILLIGAVRPRIKDATTRAAHSAPDWDKPPKLAMRLDLFSGFET